MVGWMGRGGGRRGQATVAPSRCGEATGKREEVGDRVKE
uniref:Uncharacterized protein n=1 Tax=Triticum urartu TaxID=4572 RepID=A0A8R7RA13_TRIUA